MFGGNNPKSSASSTPVDTLIGRQTEVLGDVRFSGGLHVDGKVKGKIIANSDKAASLSVSDTGLIEGDVRVPNIVLNGAVTGDVHATEKITLAAKARVNGNVYYKIIEMEGGATVNGQLVHEGEAGRAPAALAQKPAAAVTDESVDQLSEVRRAKGL